MATVGLESGCVNADFAVNGYDMTFVERGAGAPLLLVHGTLGDYRHWAAKWSRSVRNTARSPSA